MFLTRFGCLLAAVFCVFSLAAPAAAAEVDCDATYCFSPGDFSRESSITGICITDLPENAGVLRLGSRILKAGDILTAQQVAQMTFSPLRSETDQSVQMGYLPIYEDFVDKSAAMTISIRGKEDKAPVAEDQALETYRNLPNTAKLKVSDPEGQELTYTVTRQPKRGTVEIQADGSFTYTPKKNKVGVDSFRYTAADPAGKTSREATVTVTILKPSDATQYTDTLGQDCRFAAEWMKHTGIFAGETLGQTSCFGPEKEVTRGEFVTMLVKALDIPVEEDLIYTGYTDDIPQWLQPYLAAAVRAGVTAGMENHEVFGAGDAITEGDAMAMIRSALDQPDQETFAPEAAAPLTRSQAAQILYTAAQAAAAV